MNQILDLHKSMYKKSPLVVASAPGVLRLLGVVSEENKGFALQSAFNRVAKVSISPRGDGVLNCFSVQEDDRRQCSVKSLKNRREDRWLNLLKGVISEYALLGCEVEGMDILLSSDIPQGVGLSSSTAIAVATALALKDLYSFEVSDIEVVQTAFLAESRFMDRRDVFLLDTITSFFSKEGEILIFDARKMEYQSCVIESTDHRFYLLNSNVPIQIDKDEIDRREKLFFEIRAMLKRRNLSSIRDFDDFDLKQAMTQIPENARRFCIHIADENSRVNEAVIALESGKLALFGKLLTRSQESLRDNYEISCPEIDWLIKRVVELEGVYGARITGRGFGGPLIVTAQTSIDEQYKVRLEEYERIFGFSADFFELKFSSGASILFSSHNK